MKFQILFPEDNDVPLAFQFKSSAAARKIVCIQATVNFF
jgi:hypothetical protein